MGQKSVWWFLAPKPCRTCELLGGMLFVSAILLGWTCWLLVRERNTAEQWIESYRRLQHNRNLWLEHSRRIETLIDDQDERRKAIQERMRQEAEDERRLQKWWFPKDMPLTEDTFGVHGFTERVNFSMSDTSWDDTLPEKLGEHMRAMARWMVRGCRGFAPVMRRSISVFAQNVEICSGITELRNPVIEEKRSPNNLTQEFDNGQEENRAV